MGRRSLFCLDHLRGLGKVVEVLEYLRLGGGLGLGLLAVLNPEVVQGAVAVLPAVVQGDVEGGIAVGQNA